MPENQFYSIRGAGATSLAEVKARFRRVLENEECDTWPSGDALVAPQYADADRLLYELGLERNILLTLLHAGINTIAELAETSISQLFQLLNGDAAALERCRQSFSFPTAISSSGVVRQVPVPKVSAPSSIIALEQIIQTWLNPTTERNHQIICRYLGLGCEAGTLQEVGDAFDLTRERVRQIVTKYQKRLKQGKTGLALKCLSEKMCELVRKMGGVMTLGDIEEYLPIAIPLGATRPADAANLLASVSDKFEWWPKLKILVLSELKNGTLQAIWDDLKTEIGKDISVEDAEDLIFRVASSWMLRDEGVTQDTVRAALRCHPELHIADGQAEHTTTKKKDIPGALEETIEALRRIGRPAHYTEIAAMVAEMRGYRNVLTKQSMYQRMYRFTEAIVRVGQGTFGLAEWDLSDYGHPDSKMNPVLTGQPDR